MYSQALDKEYYMHTYNDIHSSIHVQHTCTCMLSIIGNNYYANTGNIKFAFFIIVTLGQLFVRLVWSLCRP